MSIDNDTTLLRKIKSILKQHRSYGDRGDLSSIKGDEAR